MAALVVGLCWASVRSSTASWAPATMMTTTTTFRGFRTFRQQHRSLMLAFVDQLGPPHHSCSHRQASTTTKTSKHAPGLTSVLSKTPARQQRLLHYSRNNDDPSDTPTTRIVDQHRQTSREAQMTSHIMDLVTHAIAAVHPTTAIPRHCQRLGLHMLQIQGEHYDLQDYADISIVAFGKASSGMAKSLVEVLVQGNNENIAHKLSGHVIVKDCHAILEEIEFLARYNISVKEASHPIPDERAVRATQHILQSVAANDNKRRLVLVCISGGGSALFCAPHPRLTLEDLQATNQALLQSGWSIHEMNVVRKKLEVAKGGGLLAHCHQSDVVSLILSDVLGDPLELIASGPTVPDTSTWRDAWELCQRLPPSISLPSAVVELLEEGKTKEEEENNNQRVDDSLARKSHTCLVGNNALAVERAAQVAQELGYQPIVLGTQLQGEAKDVAQLLVSMAEHLQQGPTCLQPYNVCNVSKQPVALIAGGETTVTLPPHGAGKGGRNQELALAAAVAMGAQRQARGLPPLRNVVVASVGTDGTDGPTDAAGAVVDGGTVVRLGAAQAQEALQTHNAYPYLQQHDEQGVSPLIVTGPTGTNVCDLMVVLVDTPDT